MLRVNFSKNQQTPYFGTENLNELKIQNKTLVDTKQKDSIW